MARRVVNLLVGVGRDNRGIVWGAIVLILTLFVFSIAYLLTYHFIFVDAREAFDLTQVPQEVLTSFDKNWNLIPYAVFGGLGIWFVAYAIRKTGRWG